MSNALPRIAFNATALLSPLTGIGQYSRQLALGLAARDDLEVDFLYGTRWSREVLAAPLPRAIPAGAIPWLRQHLPYAYELRRLVQNARFAQHARQDKVTLYHEPNILPLNFAGPAVVTVHDISWVRYPDAHPPERVRALNKYFPAGLAQARLILTPSEFIKRELIEVFGVAPARVRPVLLGVESSFRPMDAGQTQAVMAANGLVHGRYLLGVGTLEPRKNLALALQAFMRLSPALRKQYPLVLVGMKGWNTSALERQIEPLVATGEIRQLGYLPRAGLAAVMAGATALVYPSIYEGFGLPPLEAMACGVPVIVSNVSSLPEVVGDTGLLIDPQDVDGLTAAMQQVLASPELRQSLSRQALARSATFTWARCVDQTVDVYREALSKS